MALSVKYSYTGANVKVFTMDSLTTTDKLEPMIYSVKFDPISGFYLSKFADSYAVPKLYGSVEYRAQRVISTYYAREASTGVLLTGDKGTGKSLLVKAIANCMINDGLPVITVAEKFAGEAFSSFINMLGPCVLIFDEFAKIFPNTHNDSAQDELLTLFDGLYGSSKRLVLLTENDKYAINEFMLGRPGRVFYHFEYTKVEPSIIDEYCADFKLPKKFMEDLHELRNSSLSFSFDVLQAIVEEHLRYGEDVDSIVKLLNTGLSPSTSDMLEVISVTRDNVVYKLCDTEPLKMPTPNRGVSVYVVHPSQDIDNYEEQICVDLYYNNLKYQKGDTYVFDDLGYVVIAKKKVTQQPFYASLI